MTSLIPGFSILAIGGAVDSDLLQLVAPWVHERLVEARRWAVSCYDLSSVIRGFGGAATDVCLSGWAMETRSLLMTAVVFISG
ncbi:hypothetical protein B0O80DRAFT_67703 [Mortierella sp. GBAus27b]|nr:hypothetical protein B0O80DRAFT_67703 [Mortierella sp. GBAus27b]